MYLKSHYNNLIEFDCFIRKAFSVCCMIRGLDPSNYNLIYDFSETSTFAMYIFPNKIIIYVNTLIRIGENPNANKTFIVHTLLHESFHSTQIISSEHDSNITEQAADILAFKYIERYGYIIERELGFVIDKETLNLCICQYKDYNYTYHKSDMYYIYKNLLDMITNNLIDFDLLLKKSELYIRFIDEKTNDTIDFIIKYKFEFMNPNNLINYITNSIIQYSKITYKVSIIGGVIVYTILDYSINPIELG